MPLLALCFELCVCLSRAAALCGTSYSCVNHAAGSVVLHVEGAGGPSGSVWGRSCVSLYGMLLKHLCNTAAPIVCIIWHVERRKIWILVPSGLSEKSFLRAKWPMEMSPFPTGQSTFLEKSRRSGLYPALLHAEQRVYPHVLQNDWGIHCCCDVSHFPQKKRLTE